MNVTEDLETCFSETLTDSELTVCIKATRKSAELYYMKGRNEDADRLMKTCQMYRRIAIKRGLTVE